MNDEWLALIADPVNHDQDPVGKTQFLKTGKYETSRLEAVGISNGGVRRLANGWYKQHRGLSMKELIPAANRLMTTTDILEAQLFVLFLLEKYHRKFDEQLFAIIDTWIEQIDYWAIADHLSINVLTYFALEQAPYDEQLVAWSQGESYWRRRLSLTAYVKRVRSQPELAPTILTRAAALLPDDNYYIRKAIPWVLRESYRKHPQHQERVTAFVRNHISYFSKTMLRETIRYLADEVQQDLLEAYDQQPGT